MGSKMKYIFCILLLVNSLCAQELNPNPFPDDFLFGVATASYQVEGAWDTNGKGENIWDRLTHEHPEMISDSSTGDVACDSYNHVLEDVELLRDLGVQFYRFSLSWSRILPEGYSYQINPDGIRYYNQLIDALVANNIVPMVTIYHWDLPQPLQDIGGWPNPMLADYFADFSRVAFEQFGDRVKYWFTFNEAKQTCLMGYGGTGMAPAMNSEGVGDYLCTHTVLKAHAKAYHIYDDEFRATQGGKISMVVDTDWHEPASESPEDIEAAERKMQFNFGWYAHPIYSTEGDYPQVMKDRIAARSSQEGFLTSRLPEFTAEEVSFIRGTYDFFSLNQYTTSLVGNQNDEDNPIGTPSHYKDVQVYTWHDPSWPGSESDWLKVVPWGMRKLLNWIKVNYNNPEIFITENGVSDAGELDDTSRIDYYKQYLSAVLDAIHEDQVNVKGYAAWSLLDNFEWMRGYTEKFGMVYVDFNDPERARTPKASYYVYQNIIANRTVILPEI